MSTIIGTTLNADTIRKTGGSLGTDIRIKNTSVYESDGGTSVTQNLVQGLGKVWNNLNGTGTIATRDSFNVASNVDSGTGVYTTNYTNAMSSASQSAGGFARVSGLYGIFGGNADTTFTTSSFIYSTLRYTDNNATDALIVTFNLCGDLA